MILGNNNKLLTVNCCQKQPISSNGREQWFEDSIYRKDKQMCHDFNSILLCSQCISRAHCLNMHIWNGVLCSSALYKPGFTSDKVRSFCYTHCTLSHVYKHGFTDDKVRFVILIVLYHMSISLGLQMIK